MARTVVSGRSSSRRSSCALCATTTVDADIRMALTDIGMLNPIGASTPAASGTEIRLYPAAHQRFCFILRCDAFDSWITDTTERRSELGITRADAVVAMDTSVTMPLSTPRGYIHGGAIDPLAGAATVASAGDLHALESLPGHADSDLRDWTRLAGGEGERLLVQLRGRDDLRHGLTRTAR
jgi:hypothetical protein